MLWRWCYCATQVHRTDVIMSAMASQITSLTFVYSTVYSRRRSKKTSKFRVTDLYVGHSPVTGEFPAQRASNAENVSIWWRHHVIDIFGPPLCRPMSCHYAFYVPIAVAAVGGKHFTAHVLHRPFSNFVMRTLLETKSYPYILGKVPIFYHKYCIGLTISIILINVHIKHNLSIFCL